MPGKAKRTLLALSRIAPVKTVIVAALLHGTFMVTLPVLILRSTDDITLVATSIGHFRWLGAISFGFGIYL